MTEELFIDGQLVDLGKNTGITLEFVNNVIGDIGKIELSHSYTIKVPRTARNSRILGAPQAPAHSSNKLRRYLSARYYRNGIDLLGEALAYVLSAEDEAFAIALVLNGLPALQALSESDATLNDLPNLPTVASWVNSSFRDVGEGAVLARYTSTNMLTTTEQSRTGCGPYTHPAMRLDNLMKRILAAAGVPYSGTLDHLADKVLLAAPNHAPTPAMQMVSGTRIVKPMVVPYPIISGALINLAFLTFANSPSSSVAYGWASDPVQDNSSYVRFYPAEGSSEYHATIAVKVQGNHFDYTNAMLTLIPYTAEFGAYRGLKMLSVPFKQVDGVWVCEADVDFTLANGATSFAMVIEDLGFYGASPTATDVLTAIDDDDEETMKLVTIYPRRETIDYNRENQFPLQGNLPKMKQWDFFKNYIALAGLLPVVSKGTLSLVPFNTVLDETRAVDWTDKMVGDAETVQPSTGGSWAQENRFKYAETSDFLRENPDFSLTVQDETLPAEREWFVSAFAASLDDIAVHYESDDNGATYEDIDIKPRVFSYNEGKDRLEFTDDLQGPSIKAAKYEKLQEAIREAVIIKAELRLTEIDLARFDPTKPIYLAQFGRFYTILKLQTSETQICKVELLQL